MRITFVLPYAGLAGGIRVIATYAERLQQRGHQVLVVSLPPDPLSLRQRCQALLRGQPWRPQPGPSHFDGRQVNRHILERARCVTAADVPDADVVIATWWETAEWVAAFPASKGAKVYFVQHFEAFENQPRERVEATWRLPFQKIAVSQWLVDLAQNHFGDSQVFLVPNSVDTKQFFAPVRCKQTVPTVGLMYSDIYWKGCDIMLKAFSLAKQQVPNLRLVAFGAKQPVDALPLPPGTHYVSCPPQASLKDFYSQCDAWLFGSRTEGFGMPILEAMACRTPVIGTPVGAAPELLIEGAGILVEPEDAQDMARAIQQIHEMPEAQWQMMSEAAYTKAVRYTWDDAVTQFETALRTTIEQSQRQRQPSYLSKPCLHTGGQ
ncbi:MAG: glycosyltransferase family 4 protein [Synechococcales cyanobacterium M58_A2018_015]|nr:glycosyltransferase family 4 protein [Synechococcales cyanobacterium M58_A2018_015]